MRDLKEYKSREEKDGVYTDGRRGSRSLMPYCKVFEELLEDVEIEV